MFERIIRFSIEQRWLILLAVLGMAALGVFSYQKLPIDAVPDITNVQVQINTAAPGYSPLEAEQRVTYPIETVMAGLPRPGADPFAVALRPVAGDGGVQGRHRHLLRAPARERTHAVRRERRCRPGVTPVLGPIATGLGEIYLWTVEAEEGAQTRRQALHADRPARDPGLDRQARSCATCRRDRDQHHRRLCHAKEFQVAPDPASCWPMA
jgi:cobalt-zinc-cadmium resistance protein CzcA